MKKFNIRAILLILLVAVMVFSLSACGEKKPDSGNTPGGGGNTPSTTLTVADYFNQLWDDASEIGSESIAETDNVALHADLALALMLQDGGNVARQTVDVGIALDVVIDRTTAESTGTAFRAHIYDPTNNGENWFTGYFFFNDVDNIYIDYAGKNIKVPFDLFNDTFGAGFHNFLTQKEEGGMSINDALNRITDGMGADWTLDSLIDGVIAMTGINLQEMLADYLPMVESVIGAPLFDANGKLAIKSVLTSATASSLFSEPTVKTSGTKKTYTTGINKNLLSTVSGLVGGMMAGLDEIVNQDLDLKLEFAEDNGAFDHFTLSVSLGSVTQQVGRYTLHPVVALTINNIEVKKATANEIAIDRTNYSTDVMLDSSISLSLDNITINPRALGVELDPISLDNTTLTLGVQGHIDLLNHEDNETVANVYAALNGSHILDLTYSNAGIGLAIDQNAALNGVPVWETIVQVFGDQLYTGAQGIFEMLGWDASGFYKFEDVFFGKTDDAPDHSKLNPSFSGAVWKLNVDLVGAAQNAIENMFGGDDENSAEQSAEPTDNTIKKVVDVVKACIPLIDTANNKLTISSTDVFGKVVEIGKMFDAKFSLANSVQAIIDGDADGWLPRIIKFFSVSAFSWDENKTDAENSTQFLTQLLTNLGATIVVDLGTNGFDMSVSATALSDVSVSLSLHFGVQNLPANGLRDVVAEYDANGSTGAWVLFDLR